MIDSWKLIAILLGLGLLVAFALGIALAVPVMQAVP
jgi:hypothetical protein